MGIDDFKLLMMVLDDNLFEGKKGKLERWRSLNGHKSDSKFLFSRGRAISCLEGEGRGE